MSSFKKLIALVLAFVMIFSFAAVGAGFRDLPNGTATAKAVDLLSGLGVIGGYPDGTFGAEKTISRAEFLKILFVLTNGTGEESLYGGRSSEFADVEAGTWYLAYVNWAVQLKIVGGYPDGTFKPDNPVTLAEASKMYVTALGYNAADYAFPYGFVDRARKSGLFADVSNIGADDPAPRGVVALMGSNFLFVPDAPGYSFWDSQKAGGADWNFKQPIAQNFGARAQAVRVNGTSGMPLSTGINKAGKISFSELNIVNGNPVYGAQKIYDTTINADNLVMHYATAWFKDTTKGEELIAIVDDAEKVITATYDTMVVAEDKIDDLLRYDVYTVIDGVNVPLFLADRDTNGKSLDSYDASWKNYGGFIINGATEDASLKSIAALSPDSGRGPVEFTFIDNIDSGSENPEWDSVFINYWVTGKVTSVSSGSIAIEGVNNGTALLSSQIGGSLSGFKEGDYANVTVFKSVINGVNTDFYVLEKAEVINGATLSAVSTSRNTIRLDGTTYNVSLFSKINLRNIVIGTEADVVLDKNGDIFATDMVAQLENYMLITNISQSNDSLGNKVCKVTGLLTDGKTKTFTVNDDDLGDVHIGTDPAKGHVYKSSIGWTLEDGTAAATKTDIGAIGKLVVYKLNSDDEIINMYQPDNKASATSVYRLDEDSSIIYEKTSGSTSYKMSKFVRSDTPIFTYDNNNTTSYSDDSFKVTTMSRQSSFDDTKFAFMAFETDDASYASIIFVTDGINKASATYDMLLAMRTGDYTAAYVAGSKRDAYLEIEFFIDGERKTLVTDSIRVSSDLTQAELEDELVDEFFRNTGIALSSGASGYFGYAELDSRGRLQKYYEKAAVDVDGSGNITRTNRITDISSFAESETRHSNVTVYRAALLSNFGYVVELGEVDQDGRATGANGTYASTALIEVARDAKITVINDTPDYADFTNATATSTTVDSLSKSQTGTGSKGYVIDFTISERSDGTMEITQIIAYAKPVEN